MAADDSGSIADRVIRGTGWLMAWRMTSKTLGFVSTLVLARLLVPADFGIVALATSISAGADALSQVGVRDALVRLQEERREWFDTAFTIQVLRGCLTGAVVVGIGLSSEMVTGDPRVKGVLLALAGLAVLSGFENVGVVTITRQMNFRAQVLIQVAPRLLGFAVTVTLASVLRDYRALIWGTAASRVAAVAVTYAVSAHWPRFGLSGWRYLVGFSLWTWAASLAMVVWSRSDPWLMAPVLGASRLGAYVIGWEIAILPITELLEPVCGALFPGFAYAQRTGRTPLTGALTVAGVLVLFMAPLAIGLSATSGYAVAGLLGPGWQQVRPIVAILAWACLFSPFSYVCSSALVARGEVKRVFVANAIAAIAKACLILVVRNTGSMRLVSGTIVAAVAAECALFIWQLRASEAISLRPVIGMGCRLAISGTATTIVLYAVPGTWQDVDLGQFQALLQGGGIGLVCLAAFGVAHALLWAAAGCPPGPELWIRSKGSHLVSGWVKADRSSQS